MFMVPCGPGRLVHAAVAVLSTCVPGGSAATAASYVMTSWPSGGNTPTLTSIVLVVLLSTTPLTPTLGVTLVTTSDRPNTSTTCRS